MPDARGPRAVHRGQRVTTDATLERDLHASLRQARGAGTTIGDFLEAVLGLGLGLQDPLSSIEYGVGQGGTGRLTYERDEHGKVEITEVYR